MTAVDPALTRVVRVLARAVRCDGAPDRPHWPRPSCAQHHPLANAMLRKIRQRRPPKCHGGLRGPPPSHRSQSASASSLRENAAPGSSSYLKRWSCPGLKQVRRQPSQSVSAAGRFPRPWVNRARRWALRPARRSGAGPAWRPNRKRTCQSGMPPATTSQLPAAPMAHDAGRGRGGWAQTGPIACRLRVCAGRGGARPLARAVQRAAYSARLPALTAALSVLDALPAAAGALFAGLAVSAGTASALAVALRLGALATGRRLRAVPHS